MDVMVKTIREDGKWICKVMKMAVRPQLGETIIDDECNENAMLVITRIVHCTKKTSPSMVIDVINNIYKMSKEEELEYFKDWQIMKGGQ